MGYLVVENAVMYCYEKLTAPDVLADTSIFPTGN